MNFKALILLVVVAVASAQVAKIVVDDFEVETATLIILITADNIPTSLNASTSASSILGGERDLLLTAQQGTDNVVLTAGVSNGNWAVSTPEGASGYSFVQYDGIDGSPTLNPIGLGGIDITSNSSYAFQLVIQSDLATQYTVSLTSTNGGAGTYLINVPGGDTATQYIVLYTDFNGNVDFTAIGSIEVQVEALENVDALMYTLTTWGSTTGITPSNTPAPAAFSASKTPVPYISWYTFDDDDDGVSPCGDEQPNRRTYFLQDEDIVYYYFYGFSDPPVQYVTVNGASLLASGLISLIALLVL